jgi:hypothetical protein
MLYGNVLIQISLICIPLFLQPNYVNICTCLDILSFLLTILRKDQILVAFKPLQKSIAIWCRFRSSFPYPEVA